MRVMLHIRRGADVDLKQITDAAIAKGFVITDTIEVMEKHGIIGNIPDEMLESLNAIKHMGITHIQPLPNL